MGEELPAAVAVINPNRQDDLSGQGHLCAAGVTFLFLIAVTRHLRRRGFYGAGHAEPDLLSWLDLVALATVCDVVPLQGVNRAFVAQGLKVMHRRRNAGLRALADAAGMNSAPTPYHLGFLLGPRINAGGRIGDAALGSRLLASDDERESVAIAGVLNRLNRERQEMEQRCCQEAWPGGAEAGRRPGTGHDRPRLGGLAQGTCRPCLQPPDRSFPPPVAGHCMGRGRRAWNRLGPLDRRRRYRLCGARRVGRGWRKKAAAMPWLPASPSPARGWTRWPAF